MIRLSFPRVPPGLLLLLLVAAPAAAQEEDIAQLFSNDTFYAEHGIPQARGDVPFVGDLWLLPGTPDSTLGLLGVGLSNTALRFTRDDNGEWHARYRVVARLEPERGAPFERSWEQTVDVTSFDETLLTGETIVFQAQLPLAPGRYTLDLSVADLNADESSEASVEFEAPALGTPSVGEPVLLRRVDRTRDPVTWVVHPSHTFPSPPDRISFMLVARAADGTYTARARLVDPRADEGAGMVGEWSDTLRAGDQGGLVAFGAIDNTAQFGEYRLDVDVMDVSGSVVTHATTPLVIAGSAAWLAENWKEALSLIRYEATEKEMDILEDIDDPAQRIEAWACFWRLRDPISTTAVNEAMQDYFARIETANDTWKSALRPGYQSDRGRAYVTLGPPDDIQSNPMPFGQLPFEIWTYQRGRQFQLLFVDKIGFNNYQLDNMATYQRELGSVERQKRAVLATRAAQCPLLAPAFD
jgi:GWxTD domain-containing protein